MRGSGGAPGVAPLTASFEDVPEAHDGESAFTVHLALSEPVANAEADLRDHALEVTGGTVEAVGRVDGRSDLWSVTLVPAGTGAVTVSVEAGESCGDPGTLCTATGEALSQGASATVEGPGVAALTARFDNVPASHDGASAFRIEIVFNETPHGTGGWLPGMPNPTLREILEVAGGRLGELKRVNRNGAHRYAMITPDGDGPVTVTLEPSETCGEALSLCTEAGGALAEAVSVEIGGPSVTVTELTARFENMPASHDGSAAFRIEIVFNETPHGTDGSPHGMRNSTLREILDVSGGAVSKLTRVRHNGAHRYAMITPDGDGPVTVSLAPSPTCGEALSLCTDERRTAVGAHRLDGAGAGLERPAHGGAS